MLLDGFHRLIRQFFRVRRTLQGSENEQLIEEADPGDRGLNLLCDLLKKPGQPSSDWGLRPAHRWQI